jgi:hypothetical protein
MTPQSSAEHADAIGRFSREWDREMAKEKDRAMRASVQVALRAVEERPFLMQERDLAVKHAGNSVFYVRRLRAKLDAATARIRDLETENRALREARS